MAYIDELHQGLIKADAAGNAEDAKAFADEIRKQTPAETSGFGDNVIQAAKAAWPLLIPGGSALKGANLAAQGSEEFGGMVTDATKSPALGYAANVASQIPMVALGGGLGSRAAPAAESGAKWLMGNAIKPSLGERLSGKGDIAIQAMLDEGLNATRGGVEVLKQKIGDLNSKVAEIISSSSETINKNAVANYLQSVVKRFENRPNAVEAQKAVEDAWTRFIKHPMTEGQSNIPIQTAQDLKKGYQASVGDKAYGELKTVDTETEKAIARGLREKISEAAPEVAGLNAQESKLITTLNVVEKRALMELNRNPGGLAFLAHNPGMFAAYVADKSALFKSLAARLLNAQKGNLPTTVGATAGAGYDLAAKQ